MLRWFRKASNNRDFLVERVLEADSFQVETKKNLADLTAKLIDMEQTLQSVAKTLRRVHLSCDQNFSMLREVQCTLKERFSAVEQPEDSYLFTQAELLEFLDSSMNTSPEQQGGHHILLRQLDWQPIAEIDQSYHPLHCEVIEAVADACEPGLVRHIIQQGYLDSEGNLIRRAKVIVSKISSGLSAPEFFNSESLTT
jgi:hypothetical protein